MFLGDYTVFNKNVAETSVTVKFVEGTSLEACQMC